MCIDCVRALSHGSINTFLRSDSVFMIRKMGVWNFLEPHLLRSLIHTWAQQRTLTKEAIVKCESHISDNTVHTNPKAWNAENSLFLSLSLCVYHVKIQCIVHITTWCPYSHILSISVSIHAQNVHVEKLKLPFLSINVYAHDVRTIQTLDKIVRAPQFCQFFYTIRRKWLSYGFLLLMLGSYNVYVCVRIYDNGVRQRLLCFVFLFLCFSRVFVLN